jgi:hypothetical protein
LTNSKQQQEQQEENDSNKLDFIKLEKAKMILRQPPDISNYILEFVISLSEDEPIKKVTDKPPIIATNDQQKEMEERLAKVFEITLIRNTTPLSFEKYPDKYHFHRHQMRKKE